MQRLNERFTSADRQRVAAAVAQAEARTNAEIVPAIATTSGRYDRAEDLVGLWTAVALLVLVWSSWHVELPEPNGWEEPAWAWQLAALVASVIIGFAAGAAAATKIDGLRRAFVSSAQRHDETWGKAVRLFHSQLVSRTAGRTGVLVYVSLFERTAAIVADDAVLAKLGQQAIDDLCRTLVDDIKRDGPIAALSATIARLGERLAAPFPASAPPANELADALILLD